MRQTEKVLLDIQEERERQIRVKGWTEAHDDEHDGGTLAAAASAYACCAASQAWNPDYDPTLVPCLGWPWDSKFWKPRDARSNLVRAAALIVAEIERIDRKEQR